MEAGFLGGILNPGGFFSPGVPVDAKIDVSDLSKSAEVETFAPEKIEIQTEDEKIAPVPVAGSNWLSGIWGALTKGSGSMIQAALPALTSLMGAGSKFMPESSASSKAESGFGSDDDSFRSGDIIIGGSKDSFLTMALIAGTVIVVASIIFKKGKAK